MEINTRNAMMADLKARTAVLRGTFDYVAKRERLDEVNLELEDPNVWNNPKTAQALGRERASLETVVETIDDLHQSLDDQKNSLLCCEEGGEDGLAEVDEELERLEKLVDELEFHRMFSGEADGNNCYLIFRQARAERRLKIGEICCSVCPFVGLKREALSRRGGSIRRRSRRYQSATIHIQGEYATAG